MASYKLFIKHSVAKDLGRIPVQDVVRILKLIEALVDDSRPLGCEKLSGQEKYRVRQGPYRIISEIKDKEFVVFLLKVGIDGKYIYSNPQRESD